MKNDETKLKVFLSKYNHKNDKPLDQELLLPKISIVTPSYNQGRFLERTILSVLNQGYPDLEYIIFDGGSSDNSIDIIKKYEKHLSCWKSEPDEGQSDAISKGFDMATGDILAWINSDDVYWPGAFDYIGRFFAKHPDLDVIYGDSFTIDEDDNLLRETRSVKFSPTAFKTMSFSLHQASIFWRRDIYKRSSGVNKSLHLTMDRDLWFQFFQLGARFRHVPRTLSCYRAHPDTKTSQSSPELKRLIDECIKERFNIDPKSMRFRLTRKVMRARTLLLHILNGNIRYLLTNAGLKDNNS